MISNILMQESEYKVIEIGDKKVILSVLDSLDIGDESDLGFDFSGSDLVIYGEDLLISKELKANSVFISAFSISTGTQQISTNGNQDKQVYLHTDDDLTLRDEKILEIFDYSNEKYTSITANSLPENILRLDKQANQGLKNIDLTKFMFIHPIQCSMLLQKAKWLYQEADPVVNTDSLKQAMTILKRITDRTQIFSSIKKDSPLVQLYNKNEASIGALNSIEIFTNIYNTANDLLGQIKNGNDYYGNSYQYVPLASFSFYQNILTQQIKQFAVVESTFLSFFQAEPKEEKRLQDLQDTRNHLDQVSAVADSEIQQLKPRISETDLEIQALQSQFKVKQAIVQEKIEDFKHALEDSFYLDIKSLFSSITTLAFFSPEQKFGLVAGGAQIGYDIYDASKNVQNDQGVSINKDYLVGELKSFEGDLNTASLQEQYEKMDDGKIHVDDPGANKLIAEEQKVDTFLSQFYQRFPSQVSALEDAFQDYVNLVQERNKKILYYNSLVTMVIKYHNIIKSSEQKKVILNNDNLKKYKPDLPAFTDIMTSLYSNAQSQVMSTLYLTQRAFSFWSLSDEKPVSETFKGKEIYNINQAVIAEGQINVLNAYSKAVENYGNNAQQFPANKDDKGIIWKLSASKISMLQKENGVLFKIPLATSESTKVDSPFAGLANVRLTKVRVWVDGAITSDDQLTVNIAQTGNEKIVSTNNDEFDFNHNQKNLIFIYDLKGKKIFEDGDIGINDQDRTYAVVGPFTWWHVSVRTSSNKSLDLSKVTNVSLEFHGKNYSFLGK